MDDETANEAETAERDGLDGEEAHRVGEFDELRDLIRALGVKIDGIRDAVDAIGGKFTDSVAQMIENGAVVREDDAAAKIAEDAADDLENLDYTL